MIFRLPYVNSVRQPENVSRKARVYSRFPATAPRPFQAA